MKEGETLKKVKRSSSENKREGIRVFIRIIGIMRIMCYLEKGKEGKVYLRGEVAVGLKEEDIKLCYWIRENWVVGQ